jgi:hypothetical protein
LNSDVATKVSSSIPKSVNKKHRKTSSLCEKKESQGKNASSSLVEMNSMDNDDDGDEDDDSSSDFEEDLPLAALAEQSSDDRDLLLHQWSEQKEPPVSVTASPTSKLRPVSRSPEQCKTIMIKSKSTSEQQDQLFTQRKPFSNPRTVTDEEISSLGDNAREEDLRDSQRKYSLRTSAYLQNLAEICFTILVDRRWRVGLSLEPLFRWEHGEDLSIVTALSRLYIPPQNKRQHWPCKCLLCREKKQAPPAVVSTSPEASNNELSPDNDSEEVRALYLYCRLFYRKGPWFRLDDVYNRYYAPKKVTPQVRDTDETKNFRHHDRFSKSFFKPVKQCTDPELQNLPKQACYLDEHLLQQHLKHSVPRLLSDFKILLDRGYVRLFHDEIECGKSVGETLLTADERTAILLKLGGCNKKRHNTNPKVKTKTFKNEIWAQMRQQQAIYASQATDKICKVLPVQRHVESVLLEKLARSIVMSCSNTQYVPAAVMHSAIQMIFDSFQSSFQTLFQSTNKQSAHMCFRLREKPTRTLQRCVRLLLCATSGPAEMRGDGTNGWRSVLEWNSDNLPFAGVLAPPTVQNFHQIQYPGLSHRFGLRAACFMNTYVHLPIEKENPQPPYGLREHVFVSVDDFHRWELCAELRANVDYLVNLNEMCRYEKRQNELGKSARIGHVECTSTSVDLFDLQAQESRHSFWYRFFSLSASRATSLIRIPDALDRDVSHCLDIMENDCEKVLCIIGVLSTYIIAAHCQERPEDQHVSQFCRPWLRHLTWQGCLAYVLWDIVPFFERKGLYEVAINALSVLIYGELATIDNFFHKSMPSKPGLSPVLLSRRARGKAFERLIIDYTHLHRKTNCINDQAKKQEFAACKNDLVETCKMIILDMSPRSGIGFSAIRTIARRLKRPLSEILAKADNLEAKELSLRMENFDCNPAECNVAKYTDWKPLTDFFLANSLSSDRKEAGSRCAFVGFEDGEDNGRISSSSLNVEELAMDLYGSGRLPVIQDRSAKGGWKGWHNEGGHIRALFRIMCSAPILGMDWGCRRFNEDDGLLGDLTTIYLSPYQHAPFDLHVGHERYQDRSKTEELSYLSFSFYNRRSTVISAFLNKLAKMEGQDLCDLVFDAIVSRATFMRETGQSDPVVCRDLINVRTLSALAAGFGGAQLAAIFRCMFFDYRHYCGGLPDLQLFRALYDDCFNGDNGDLLVDLSEWIGESFSTENQLSLSVQRAAAILSDDEFLACSKAGDSGVILNKTGRGVNTNGSAGGDIYGQMLQWPPERLQLMHKGRPVKVECMLVEVKSSNDRLDARQEDWLNVLDRLGNARVCKFTENKSGSKKRSR